MRSGFTLIETLVVIAITAILSTIFIALSSSSQGDLTLYTERDEIASVLGRAKSLALEKYTTGAYATATCAFGVDFSSSTGQYFIYGVSTSSNNCLGMTDYTWSGNSDKYKVQTLELDNHLKFVSPTPTDVYFVPPYFTVSAGLSTITLEDKGTGRTASIQVTSGGGISSL